VNETPARATVTVEIDGESYTIRSGASAEYTLDCAAYVDGTIRNIKEQGTLIEAHKAVILAAMSLTDQLFQARSELEQLRRAFDRQASRLTAIVQDALAADDLA